MILAFELVVSAVLAGATFAVAPDIRHEPLHCVAPGENPVVNAVIPGSDIRTAKVYFRSDKYPKFYYVEMKVEAEGFLSVLPKPSPETDSIIYYIEAIDVTFDNTIGAEHTVEVSDNCLHASPETRPVEEAPEIVVGATEAGASALPPGFETAGIVGTITAAGVGSILGGGSGISTAVVAGGVAAGVGGAVATQVVLEDSTPAESTPEAPPPRPEPSPGGASPPPPPASPQPSPPPAEPPEEEPEEEPVPAPAPAPPVPSSPLTACFTSSFPGQSCNLKVDAACSSGSITTYAWEFVAGPELGGSTTAVGITANRTFPRCMGEDVRVVLTVSDGAGGTDVLDRSVTLPNEAASLTSSTTRIRTSWVSTLDARPWNGAVHGTVEIVGTRADDVANAGPYRHEHDAHFGKATVEATLVSEVGGEARWTFDFSDTPQFFPGSLRPLRGAVLASTDRTITFRLHGAPGERVRFEYRLEP